MKYAPSNTPPAFTAASARSINKPWLPAAIDGRATTMGTTARSWAIRMPSATRPCSAPSSPRSSRTFSVTTVLDRASSAPRNTPWVNVSPRSGARSGPRPMVHTSWSAPPNVPTRPMRRSSASETSAPSANISSATPISARTCTECVLAVGPGVNGPIATPASRYPRMTGCPKRCASVPPTNAASTASTRSTSSCRSGMRPCYSSSD